MKRLFNKTSLKVNGETALFIDKDEISLLFPAKRIDRVYCTKNGVEYCEGRDYAHEPGSKCLKRLPGSAIPKMGEAWLHPDPAVAKLFPDPEADAIAQSIHGGLLPFDNRVFFASNQIEIDYTAEKFDLDVQPKGFSGRLPRLAEKLNTPGASLRISFVGDSITEGYNASAMFKIPPFQPPYPALVGEALQEQFGVNVETLNRGVGGMSSNYPLEHFDYWLNDKPDLLVIAFGMNDFSAMGVDQYLNNLDNIVRHAKIANPNVEILHVASMFGNPEWSYTPAGFAELFAEKLHGYVAAQDEHVNFTDQCEVWTKFLARKNFYDLTGNGVNHPNDFGHRILASNILMTLAPQGAWL